MQDRHHLYIDGAWVDPAGDGRIEVEEPATERVLASIPEATPADVDRAVDAARRALPGWAATSRAERRTVLQRVLDGLSARADEVATTITREVGTPIRIAKAVQVGLPTSVLASYVELLEGDDPDETVGNSLLVRHPVGVVGAITPWNYPLHQVVAKIAPALAAGCTVVLKPSEIAPLVAYLCFDVLAEADLPPGVVNLVPGHGPSVGEAIAGHRGIDAVSFTGSVAAGARVAELAAPNITRVTLELGGKSANVVLPDADLELAVKAGVSNAFLNGGQTCAAWTRLLVPRERHDEAVELAAARAEGFTPGDPLDPTTKLGPLSSGRQKDRVLGYVRTGVEQGAQLATGGPDAPDGLDVGHYVRPTVFGAVERDHTIAQEEIFGPVLSVLAYTDEDDAVAIANGTSYGLAGGVWAGDEDTAVAFARRLRTGQVDINGGQFNPRAPFGGFKRSGLGRELGRFGLDEFQEISSLQR